MMSLTTEEQACFAELAAQIVATLGGNAPVAFQADPVAVLMAAHEKRQAFIQEMLDARSERARMARKVPCASVYARAVGIVAAQQAIEHCEHIAEHSYRKAIGLA